MSLSKDNMIYHDFTYYLSYLLVVTVFTFLKTFSNSSLPSCAPLTRLEHILHPWNGQCVANKGGIVFSDHTQGPFFATFGRFKKNNNKKNPPPLSVCGYGQDVWKQGQNQGVSTILNLSQIVCTSTIQKPGGSTIRTVCLMHKKQWNGRAAHSLHHHAGICVSCMATGVKETKHTTNYIHIHTVPNYI